MGDKVGNRLPLCAFRIRETNLLTFSELKQMGYDPEAFNNSTGRYYPQQDIFTRQRSIKL